MFNILVVDDSRDMRDGMARLLGRVGYSVSTADNGKTAWGLLYGGLPDLIILDLMMPEMSGVVFLRMLRNHHHWNETPVLVVTGLDHDEALVQEVRSLGVIDVIRKGSDSVDELLGRIAGQFNPKADGKNTDCRSTPRQFP
jgi:DNA-binding response OmpR family regulator